MNLFVHTFDFAPLVFPMTSIVTTYRFPFPVFLFFFFFLIPAVAFVESSWAKFCQLLFPHLFVVARRQWAFIYSFRLFFGDFFLGQKVETSAVACEKSPARLTCPAVSNQTATPPHGGGRPSRWWNHPSSKDLPVAMTSNYPRTHNRSKGRRKRSKCQKGASRIPNKPDNVTINTQLQYVNRKWREKKKKIINSKQRASKLKKTKKTKSCCPYTQRTNRSKKNGTDAYRQRERECVCEKGVDPPSILISVHPKNPKPKREREKTNRAKCWMDWVVMMMMAGAKLVGGQNESDSGSHVPGLESLRSKGTPHRKRGIGRME